MKNSFLIALMFSFLIVNAQHDRLQYPPKTAGEQAQIYAGINPDQPYVLDLNKNKIRITDNHTGYPFKCNPYANDPRIPDMDPGNPFSSFPYMYEIRRPDFAPGQPFVTCPYKYTIRKTD